MQNYGQNELLASVLHALYISYTSQKKKVPIDRFSYFYVKNKATYHQKPTQLTGHPRKKKKNTPKLPKLPGVQ